MASCTQIDHQIQSYLDGELLLSDRAILEQHLAECPDCVHALRQHQRSNASLFEVYAPVRLKRDLTEYVMSHLPEMQAIPVDVQRLNRRAKHPTPWRERLFRLMPLSAAALLLVLAGVINARWPDPVVPSNAIALVAAVEGSANRIAATSGTHSRARERVWVQPGDRIETGDSDRLALLAVGPSELRLAENTSVRVDSERAITIERGRVFLDVAHSQRLFKVITPMGEVTVFGTRFEVFAEPNRTTVMVQEGEVQLSHRENTRVFRILRPDQRAFVEHGLDEVPVETVDARFELAWADSIHPDSDVREFFAERVQPARETKQVAGEGGFFLETYGKPLKALHIKWAAVSPFVRYSDYEIFVYSPDNSAVFKAKIPGSTFSDPRMSELEIPNTGDLKTGHPTVFVKLVPVSGPETSRVEFREVNGRIGSGTEK